MTSLRHRLATNRSGVAALCLSLIAGGCSAAAPAVPECAEAIAGPGASQNASTASSTPRPSTQPSGIDASAVDVGTKSINLRFASSRLANLVFQLDCMAELYRCSSGDYATLWKGTLGWQPADDTRLARWKALRGRRGSLPSVDVPKVVYPLPFAGAGYHLDHRLRIVAFEAASLSDLGVRLAVITPHRDWIELRTIADVFMDRFAPFWDKQGAAAIAVFNREAGELFEARKLAELVDAAASFYGADLPDAEVFLHAMFRPSLSDKDLSTYGVQLGNHGIFEIVKDQTTVASRMPVVLHELFHYLYAATTPKRRSHLMQHFVDSTNPAAMVAYGLFDEAIATALGNGLVAERVDKAAFAKRYARKNGLYGDAAINTAAKAALPAVRLALDEGRPIDDAAFVAEYIARVSRALGPTLKPSTHLKVHIEIVAESYTTSAQRLRRSMRSSSVWSFEARDPEGPEMLREFPKITALVFAPMAKAKLPESTVALFPSPVQPALRALAQAGRPFGYVAKRPGGGHIIGLFAHGADEADQLGKHLARVDNLKLGTFAVASP